MVQVNYTRPGDLCTGLMPLCSDVPGCIHHVSAPYALAVTCAAESHASLLLHTGVARPLSLLRLSQVRLSQRVMTNYPTLVAIQCQ
jgi:hypothetical protein